MTPATPLLTVSDIETDYGPVQVLFGVDFRIYPGQMMALLGRNGMGKTTTVRSIMGLTPARSGSIRFQDHEIRHRSPHRIARMGIGLVPEGRQVFPTLNVEENLNATARSVTSANGSPWGIEAVYDLFPALAERRLLSGSRLSGGEQQMLAIGRALMTQPRLLILDEATEGLAPKVRQLIWRRLTSLKAAGLTILIIDKNVEALTDICDRLTIVAKGRSVWSGTGSDLRSQPDIRRRFLGL